MKRLKHIGAGYHGTSPDGSFVLAKTDETVEVCDEKAAQLLADFPKEWEEVGAKVADKDEAKETTKGKGKK